MKTAVRTQTYHDDLDAIEACSRVLHTSQAWPA